MERILHELELGKGCFRRQIARPKITVSIEETKNTQTKYSA